LRTSWKTYEEVARYLLNEFANEFGLSRVEGKQKIKGYRSGTEWEIEGKGVMDGNEAFFIVECRKYKKSKQNQEKVGGLAYRIIDTGAKGGIIVSPLGLQRGAAKVADAENIINVHLTPESTPYEYLMRFLNKIKVGIHEQVNLNFGDHASLELIRICAKCGEKFDENNNEIHCPRCRVTL
jgi:hypothetical protein